MHQNQKQLYGIVSVTPCVPEDLQVDSQYPNEANLQSMMALYYQ